METLLHALRAKGYKMTPQRRALIAALAESGEFPTAQQLLHRVRETNPDISLDTIYRNLGLLTDLGLVNEIRLRGRDGNVFELTTNGHHHHLICITCGKTQCLNFCPVNHKDIVKAETSGFEVLSHALDFYGYCAQCRAAG